MGNCCLLLGSVLFINLHAVLGSKLETSIFLNISSSSNKISNFQNDR